MIIWQHFSEINFYFNLTGSNKLNSKSESHSCDLVNNIQYLAVDYVEIISVLGFILPGNDRSKYREFQC